MHNLEQSPKERVIGPTCHIAVDVARVGPQFPHVECHNVSYHYSPHVQIATTVVVTGSVFLTQILMTLSLLSFFSGMLNKSYVF